MTVEQAIAQISPERLLILPGRAVLFNTWDPEEADAWRLRGAIVRDFYPESRIAPGLKTTAPPGWEVSVERACDPVRVTALNGETQDRTLQTLIAAARQARA